MAEMDEEMEDTYDEDVGVGLVDFLDLEVDSEYEFDASRYFDFCRPESPSEAREAELWFETARSYPPSPFIAKIDLGAEITGKTVHIPPEFNNAANASDITYSEDGSCIDLHTTEETAGGIILEYESSKISNYFSKVDEKTKLPVGKRSTLMRPTASHLAKQNDPRIINNPNQILHRLKKSSTQNSEKSCMDVCDGADQEIKRQKLDGGLSRKVHDLKQQMQLVHKISQKKEHNDGNPGLRKLKITIPREPDLGTARRAQRTRPGRSKEELQDASTTTMFRARPLNRKILEAPSMPLHQRSTPRLPQFQEFHLKTSERAMQHASASSSSQVKNSQVATRSRLQPHPSGYHMMYPEDECKTGLLKADARSLINKKVLSTCASRSKQRETTKPQEFNQKTDKRCHQIPPVDLFNKLSLISKEHRDLDYGSKENIDKVRREDCQGIPSGEIGEKIVAGGCMQPRRRDLVTASFRASRPHLCRW